VLYIKDATEKKSLSEELKDAPTELLGIIDNLGLDKKCHGSIIDDDLAIVLVDYFKSKRNLSRFICHILL
jgi:hypothetical protein